jgi:hypothetical protein
MLKNRSIKIYFPESESLSSKDEITTILSSSFVFEKDKLAEALSLIGIENIKELFEKINRFFLSRINLDQLTTADLENFDLKRLAYEFVQENGIDKPIFETEEQVY